MSTLNIENAKKFGDLTAITEAPDSATLLIHDGNGVKKITVKNLKKDLVDLITAHKLILDKVTASGAAAHNAIYRGKDLGTSITSAQYAAISNGSFDDMYIGDYWTINGRVYRIAAFDYHYNSGDTNCATHHVVLVPDECIANARMNNDHETTGGYVNSAMYKTNMTFVKDTIKSDFPGHVLQYRNRLCNKTSGERASGWGWFDSEIELMNEVQVYGTIVWGFSSLGGTLGSTGGYNTGADDRQLPLFAMNPLSIHIRESYWLRDVCSAIHFACVHHNGHAYCEEAYASMGVRPVFSIKS